MAPTEAPRLVIKHQLLRGSATKPLRLFQRQRVDSSPQEVAAASKGEVNFGFNPLQSAAHTQSDGILPDAFIRGAVSSPATPQPHYQRRSPTTLISSQPAPPPPPHQKGDTQKLRGAKPAVITG